MSYSVIVQKRFTRFIIQVSCWLHGFLHVAYCFQSRSKHEDPEQLKLKEKAKAVSSLTFNQFPLTHFQYQPFCSVNVDLLCWQCIKKGQLVNHFCPCVHPDAAGRDGTDAPERSQPYSPCSHWPPQKTQSRHARLSGKNVCKLLLVCVGKFLRMYSLITLSQTKL